VAVSFFVLPLRQYWYCERHGGSGSLFFLTLLDSFSVLWPRRRESRKRRRAFPCWLAKQQNRPDDFSAIFSLDRVCFSQSRTVGVSRAGKTHTYIYTNVRIKCLRTFSVGRKGPFLPADG
jgi:hypothetical protein